MNRSNLVSKNPVRKILILASSPKTTPPLRLAEEVREIEEGLRRSRHRDQFQLHSRWAVRVRDLRQALLDVEPQIVHFTGHGKEDGLLVEDELGMAVHISVEALAGLFELCSDQVECVILSACYTAPQAAAISKHIDYVIGMEKEIKDKAAIEFSVGFYDALGAGKSVEKAFKFGRNAVQQVFPDQTKHLIPVLKKREGLEEQDRETGTSNANKKKEMENGWNNDEKSAHPPIEKKVGRVTVETSITFRKVIVRISIPLLIIAFVIYNVFIGRFNNKVPVIKMVHIPGGRFLRGTNQSERQDQVNDHQDWILEWFNDEIPQREIYLDEFFISEYEITNEQYGKFLKDNPGHPKPDYWDVENFNDPQQPVVGVTWNDAVAFCNWLSDKKGKKYRLPTEAEWEKAARGNDGRIFPWGNEEPDLNKANFMGQHHGTVSVKEKPDGDSAFGLRNMAGNVAEWCRDWYDENYYIITIDYNPMGPANGTRKVVRGGSWRDNAFFIRCTERNSYPPDTKREILGFRIVYSTRKLKNLK